MSVAYNEKKMVLPWQEYLLVMQHYQEASEYIYNLISCRTPHMKHCEFR